MAIGTTRAMTITNRNTRMRSSARQRRYLYKLGAARKRRVLASSPGGGSGSAGMRRRRSQDRRKELYIFFVPRFEQFASLAEFVSDPDQERYGFGVGGRAGRCSRRCRAGDLR